MNSFIWHMIDYAFCLFEISLFTSFLSNILKKKYESNLYIYKLGTILLSLTIYILSRMNYSLIIHMIISLMLLGVFTMILYDGKFINKVILVLTFYIFLGLIDIIIGNILAVLFKINLGEVLVKVAWFRVLLFSISKLILFIALKSIIYFNGNTKINIPLRYWYMLIGAFVVSIIMLFIIGEIGITTLYSKGKEKYFIIASIGIVCINIFIYYVIIELSLYYEKDKIYTVIASKNESFDKYYRDQEEHYEEIRKLKHDFNNHIICISSLARERNLDNLNDYLKDINKYIENKINYIKSGNNIVDAVLNNKISIAQKNEINIKVTAYIPGKIKISHMDLCSILANLLDNSIEACMRIEYLKRRRIEIRVSQFKQYLSVVVMNTTMHNPIENSFEFMTNKIDRKNHGFGMKIIKNIVEKYDGCINYEYNNNMFTVKILLKNI